MTDGNFLLDYARALRYGTQRTLIFTAVLVMASLISGPTNADKPTLSQASPARATAIFAGGCFWCMEPPFDALDGVISTTSGYIGGHVPNPSYQAVSSGSTGHTEALRVIYDPNTVSYQTLLDTFWRNIDPVDAGGQFCDRGSQYRSGVFYVDEDQRQLAETSKRTLQQNPLLETSSIATEITAATEFYAAEDYHQDYYQKNPKRYKFYKWNCGRDQRLRRIWGH